MSVKFKIRNKDGFYSSGGSTPRFDGLTNREWTSDKEIKAHFRMVQATEIFDPTSRTSKRQDIDDVYDGCFIEVIKDDNYLAHTFKGFYNQICDTY